MKLHGAPLSPFVQRVLFAARAKGVELEVVPLSGLGMQDPAFMEISPMRRIPVFEADDGWTLCESPVIIAYLEETQPGPSLLPADSREAARARVIAGLIDTEVAPGLRHFVTQKLFGMFPNPDQLDYGARQLTLGLDAIERVGLDSEGWAVGDRPSVADAALIPFLTLAELIARATEALPPITGRPSIDAYWARAKEMPLGKQSYDEMLAGFAALMKRKEATA